jgi:hypothetical protein
MPQTVGRILKGSDVNIEGRYQLGLGNTAAAPNGRNINLPAPQVRIVEKQPAFAVIELTCSCGQKTRIRCDYPDPNAPAEQNQNNKPKPPNKK